MGKLRKKTGRSYETLVQLIFQTIHNQKQAENICVEHDVRLRGKILTHQIDVYWKFQMGGLTYETIVQAKDWTKPVSQGELLHFKAVLDELPGQPKGIFVTRRGYSVGSKNYAQAHGIILYELHEAPTDQVPLPLRIGDWVLCKPIEISIQAPPDNAGMVVSEIALAVDFTIFEPQFSNIQFYADLPWFEQENPSSVIDKSDIKLSVPGILYDESHNAIGNIEEILRKAVEGMKEENVDKKACVSAFEHPTFIRTTFEHMPYLKVTAVSFDVDIHTRHQPPRFIFSKFVQFVLHEIHSGETRTFALPKPKE